jgi:energy-converting hydrogenase B subunit D
MAINIIDVTHIIILFTLVATALLAITFRNLLSAVISLAVFGLVLSAEFLLLHAPDVAIAEAAIGAALTTAIFIFAIKSTKKSEEKDES